LSAGDIITVFIDGETEKGFTITKQDTGSPTGVDIYTDYVRIADADDAITNADLNTGNNADSDITTLYSDGANPVFTATSRLYVASGTTFAPGGATDANGHIKIATTATLNAASDTVNVAGDFTNLGTFTHTAGTDLILDGTTVQSFNPGSSSIGSDVIISNTISVTLTTNALNISTNDLTISTNGIFHLSGLNITADTFSNDGTLRLFGSETVTITANDTDSGTWEFKGDGDSSPDTFTIREFVTDGLDYYHLTISSTDSNDTFQKLANNLQVAGNFVLSSGIQNQTTRDIYVTGTSTFSGGTFTSSATGVNAGTFTGAVTISGTTMTSTAGTFSFAG
jgi:hypothetical protein